MIFDFDRKDTIQNELYLIINKYKTNTGHYHSYRTYKIEDEETGEIEKCTIKLEEELDLYELLLDDGFNEPHKVILNYMMRREFGDLLDE